MRFSFLTLIGTLTAFRALSTEIDQKAIYLPNTEINVSSYELKLTVPSLSSGDLTAHETIQLQTLASLRYVKLHASQTAIEVTSAQVNGSPTTQNFINSYVIQVDLPTELPAGSQVTIELTYQIKRTQLENTSRTGLFHSANWHGVEVISVEDWPYYTRTWLPSNDSPADPATLEVTVDTPKNLRALSNGDLLEWDQSNAAFDRHHWKTRTEFPTYGFNLVIGNYTEFFENFCFSVDHVNNQWIECAPGLSRISLHFFAPNNGTDHTETWEGVKAAARSVVFYSSVLGEYRFEKVAFVQSPQHFLMEYPSLITSQNGSVHELAHHWFGNTVWIRNWGDFWISEGFTTYLDEVLYREFLGGQGYQGMRDRDRQFNFLENTDPLTIFDDGPYHTGASSIIELRSRIANHCGFAPRTSQENALFYGVLKSIYQAYLARPLGTLELVDFLKATLPATVLEQGCSLSIDLATREVNEWAARWFVLNP